MWRVMGDFTKRDDIIPALERLGVIIEATPPQVVVALYEQAEQIAKLKAEHDDFKGKYFRCNDALAESYFQLRELRRLASQFIEAYGSESEERELECAAALRQALAEGGNSK